MSTVTLRTRGLFPMDWPSLAWLPLAGPAIRIEEFLDGKDYVVRAELPGVDPEKDVHVMVEDGVLRIKVERSEEQRTEDGKTVALRVPLRLVLPQCPAAGRGARAR